MNKNYVLETVTVMKDVSTCKITSVRCTCTSEDSGQRKRYNSTFIKIKKLTKYEKLRRIGHVKDFNKLMLYFLCAEGPTIVSLNSILSQATANILSNLILLSPKESVQLTSGQKMLIEQQIHPQSRLDFNCLIFLWHKTVKLDILIQNEIGPDSRHGLFLPSPYKQDQNKEEKIHNKKNNNNNKNLKDTPATIVSYYSYYYSYSYYYFKKQNKKKPKS